MKIGKCDGGLLWLWLAWLAFVPSIAAQTSAQAVANKNNSDPLHQFNSSVRTLVKRVTPSVVQVMVTGYGPVEASGSTASLVLGRPRSHEVSTALAVAGGSRNLHTRRGPHEVGTSSRVLGGSH